MPRRTVRVKLSWLGHPRIELDDRPVRLDTRKSTALLAYLSLADQPVSRERLATMFWPDFDPVRAPANLRRSLATIRAALPGKWLAAERHSVGVHPSEEVWVDVRALRRLIAEVKAHGHRGDEGCPACRDRLEQAVELYRGELLEGFTLSDSPPFDDWQLAERESVSGEASWALERLAMLQVGVGDAEQALGTARRWVALDRLHEPAQALMIRLLVSTGQRSAALRHYEEFAELLNRELGAQPEPGTRKALEEPLPSAPMVSGTLVARAAKGIRPTPRAAGPFEGLLRTKLAVPQLRAAVVQRGRLVDTMKQGVARGLAVVSAPAGFGKSTLLSQWASHAGMPVAWLSLDRSDNDMHRFLLYCAATLDTAKPGLGAAAADLLGAMPPAPAQVIMTSLVNAVGSAGNEIALVLDDYQFIQTLEIHEAVRFLVERRPPLLHLVISTREDPPLPLARLRSQGALAEIRAEDLRFTDDEAGTFLNTSMSLSLSEDNVERLSRRTEGWITGLQMAALSLQGRGDADAFIAAFGGTHRHILDYLVEEVFARQDEATRFFLLVTSILGRMNAELCEALTGRRGAQEMLERLDRANLFLIALDERRGWFRYHHLFGELLLHRLERDRSVEEIRVLRLRAGDWLGANGELAEAIQQYLTAGAYDRAADLIENRYVDVLSRGGLGELLRWCREIPEETREQRPALGVVSAWALVLAGRHEATEATLVSVERALDRAGPGEYDEKARAIRGDIAIIRAFFSDLGGQSSRAIELTRIAEGLLPADHLIGRSLVFLILGRGFMYQGDLAKADRVFSDRLRFSADVDNVWAMSNAVFWLLVLRRYQGSLNDCAQMIRDYEAHVERHHARGGGHLAKAGAAAGELLREQGLREKAIETVAEAVKQVEGWGQPSEICFCLYYLMRVYRSMGLLDDAMATLERADQIQRTAGVLSVLQDAIEAERVRCWLAAGDTASAVSWAERHPGSERASPLSRHVELITVARIRLATAAPGEQLDQAVELLEGLASTARVSGWRGLLIDSLPLLAVARHRRSRAQEALAAMDEAVRLAHEGGFFQTIVEEGAQVADLLRAGLDAGLWPDPALQAYVKSIIAAIRVDTGHPGNAGRGGES